MSSSFEPNEETDYIPQNILLTGGAGTFSIVCILEPSSIILGMYGLVVSLYIHFTIPISYIIGLVYRQHIYSTPI